MNKFSAYFNNVIRYHIGEKFHLKNVHSFSNLNELIISGNIKNSKSKSSLYTALYGLELSTNQRPLLTKAKKSVAAFQLKQNMIIGFKITLRNQLLFSFLDKLIQSGLPRMREFQGFEMKRKNLFHPFQLSFGYSNIFVFPEMDYQYHIFKNILGCDITFKIKNSETSKENSILASLLTHFQYPISY